MIDQVRMQKTAIWLSRADLFSKFDITAVTHRNTSLEASKLEYINKHHLMHAASTPAGIQELAEKVHNQIKESFPGRWAWAIVYLLSRSSDFVYHNSPYATIDRIKQAIVILEVQPLLFRLAVFSDHHAFKGSTYQHLRHSQTCSIPLPGTCPELARSTNYVKSNSAWGLWCVRDP